MTIKDGSMAREALIQQARTCIGTSIYRRKAALEEAPLIFNCFRFIQWLWSSRGVQLPDHQLSCPQVVAVSFDNIDTADLVFIPRLKYTVTEDDFGHVGVATGASTVIHATKWKNGVIEEPLSYFVYRGCLGVRRVPEESYCRS